ncbi:hypothetical protein [Sphingomonas sp. Y38-1Y]|uniref:hypothetical protein n=1 Tax=Sphingomonas sp. Y38-1Y TaxID=3078265 RepID=UPI0028E18C24|nr:hypothetical protein [Sphingomonas sp. Y38-1Y]
MTGSGGGGGGSGATMKVCSVSATRVTGSKPSPTISAQPNSPVDASAAIAPGSRSRPCTAP